MRSSSALEQYQVLDVPKQVMKKYQPSAQNWSQEKYIKAYKFAARAHQGQNIPGSEIPYIMHPSFVCMEVIAALSVEKEVSVEKELDGDLAIQCALLHDTFQIGLSVNPQ